MKAPKFWRYDGIIAELLLPLSVFFYIFTVLRKSFKSPLSVAARVICVGNVVAGGAGKTPTAIAIGKLLKKKNKKFAFISKGYGGRAKNPVKVNLEKHRPIDVGDEPLLLAKTGPCWVGSSRIKTAEAAVKDGAAILILDDGLQDSSIKKDISILVVDGSYGFGNGFIIPAGPLRERLDKAIKRCVATILIGQDKSKTTQVLKRNGAKIISAFLKPQRKIPRGKYVAFAGIGTPQKFSDTLEAMGVNIVLAIEYSDHYPYSENDIFYLKEEAKRLDARLITTEKDAVRLTQKDRKEIEVLPVDLVFDKESDVLSLLDAAI